VAKLADYLWWLLPNFLKRRDPVQSLVARLCEVWGEELGEGRTTLLEIIPLLLVETATGAWLDQLARARQIFRGEGESDESLRTRTINRTGAAYRAGRTVSFRTVPFARPKSRMLAK